MKKIDFNQPSVKKIYHTNHIKFLGVFGSYARNQFKKNSDLDLLVKFSKKKSLLDLVKTERELSKTLGTKVDLLTEQSISPYLRQTIKKDLKTIYVRP